MMGMMTMVRVLPEEKYEEIAKRMSRPAVAESGHRHES
jgi:hypothetical protein